MHSHPSPPFLFEFTRRLHEGEPGAFEAIHRRFYAPLYAWVSRRVRNHALTEELIQEVFLKLWRSRRLFDPAHEFSSWLWSITRNTWIDWIRRTSGESTLPLSNSEETPCAEIEHLQDAAENPEEALELQEDRSRLQAAILKLTHLQREVLNLRLMRNLPYEEIARELDLTLSSVKGLIHRATRQLQLELAYFPVLPNPPAPRVVEA